MFVRLLYALLIVTVVGWGVALGIGGRSVFVAPMAFGVVVWMAAAGMWLPVLFGISPANSNKSAIEKAGEWASMIVLSIAGSVAVMVPAWAVSWYATKQPLAGTVVIFIVGAVGAWQLVRYCRAHGWRWLIPPPLAAGVAGLALALCGWHCAAADIYFFDKVITTCATYDFYIHMHMAAVVEHTALPVATMNGTPGQPFEGVAHWGVQVFVAGIHGVSGLPIFQGGQLAWMTSYFLLAMAGLALAVRIGKNLPAPAIGFAALSILFFGSSALLIEAALTVFGLTDDSWVARLANVHSRVSRLPGTASGTFYHNVTQAFGLAMAAATVVAIDCKWRSPNNLRMSVIGSTAIVAWLMAVSGLAKPSTFIVLGPAWLIALILRREWWQLAMSVGVFAVMLYLYLLPAFMVEVESNRSWQLAPADVALQDGTYFFFAFALVVALTVAAPEIRALWRSKGRDMGPAGFLVTALFGAVVFAALFREVGLETYANHTWSLSACMILLAPFVVVAGAQIVGKIRTPPTSIVPRILAWSAAVLLAVHLGVGLLFALQYPVIHGRGVLAAEIPMAVENARHYIPPTATVAIDPRLGRTAYLAAKVERRAMMGTNIFGPAEFEWQLWKQMFSENTLHHPEIVDARDAAIIHAESQFIIDYLRNAGWQEIVVGKNVRLFVKNQ